MPSEKFYRLIVDIPVMAGEEVKDFFFDKLADAVYEIEQDYREQWPDKPQEWDAMLYTHGIATEEWDDEEKFQETLRSLDEP